MSDFLARLAARAIGDEATLAPRLPSLFEPSAHTSILPLIREDTTATARHVTVPADDTPPVADPRHPPRATSPRPIDASRPALIEQPPTRVPPPAVTPVPDRATPVTVRAVSPATLPMTAVAAAPPRVPPPEPVTHAGPLQASPVQPRQARTVPPRPETTPPAIGTLLPPAPVFANARVAPAHEQTEHAAAVRPRAASATQRAVAASEPVVHVSIGRIEVRATPAAPAPPRRRDEPRPASLDDYLRQRGGKAPS